MFFLCFVGVRKWLWGVYGVEICMFEGKCLWLGMFIIEEVVVWVYDDVVRIFWGKSVVMNFV